MSYKYLFNVRKFDKIFMRIIITVGNTTVRKGKGKKQ